MWKFYRLLKTFFCELFFLFFSFRGNQKKLLVLRALLRSTPWWARGHILLGRTELGLLNSTKGKADPAMIKATIKTIEISADAVLSLMQSTSQPRSKYALYLEKQAKLLLQSVELF